MRWISRALFKYTSFYVHRPKIIIWLPHHEVPVAYSILKIIQNDTCTLRNDLCTTQNVKCFAWFGNYVALIDDFMYRRLQDTWFSCIAVCEIHDFGCFLKSISKIMQSIYQVDKPDCRMLCMIQKLCIMDRWFHASPSLKYIIFMYRCLWDTWFWAFSEIDFENHAKHLEIGHDSAGSTIVSHSQKRQPKLLTIKPVQILVTL